ncbi:MAG: sugar ABC transporter permease [Anaerolineae bacterium]|nr:sugar ABC transporter permease [Anaerolineae bacterium]
MFPYGKAIYISLTKWRGLTPNPEFIGLENFQKLLGDDLFWNALSHNLIYLIFIPAITLSIALYLAFLLTHGKARFSRFYRVTFFFPQVMSLVAIGVLWSFVYHPTIGILSSIAGLLGAKEPIAWLGNPDVALIAVGAVVVWQAVGFYMVLFIAGMESIPVSYYEAATIDGASRWDLFWRITLPMLWDTIRTAMVFLAIGAIDMFAITQTMTEGGPNRSTDVLATYVYDRAFLKSNFGYATAVAVAMFVLAFLLSLLTMRATQRESLEY